MYKKIQLVLFSIIAFATFNKLQGQFYFDIGLKGGYGLNLLINNNVFDDKHIVSDFSFGPTFGGRLGGNFNERHSINIEVLGSGFNQNYTIKTDSLKWNKSINVNTLDIAFLYRSFIEGSYIEVGPMFSMINSAKESNSITGSNSTTSLLTPDFISGVFGFGANFLGNDNFSVMFGFRATYSFTDIISDAGGRSKPTAYPINETFYKSNYTSYSASNPLTVRLVFEMAFDLGYFTNSTCGKGRTKFVTF